MQSPHGEYIRSFSQTENTISKEIECPHCSNRITLSNLNIAITTCSNCNKQIRLKYERSVTDGSYENTVNSKTQYLLSKKMGSKILVGFAILFIIWGIEFLGEYQKLQAIESVTSGHISDSDDTESEHSVCQDGDSYDFEKCSEKLTQEVNQNMEDAQRFVTWLAFIKIVAWGIILAGLWDICSIINHKLIDSKV